MTALHLAPGLDLPIDALTRAGTVTGQRGTGKTSTEVVEVEEASKARCPSVIIDPTDAWWGLRSNAAGDGPGLPHVVFGGDHGHLPLRDDAGAVMARLVVEQRLAAVFSLVQMRKGAQLRFVAEFLEELYHLNRDALLVVIDEAHRFAPQQMRDTERGGYGARALGALIDVATLGRKNGLGIRLVTQRLARLHKDVVEACELMIVHRLLGPNDRKAIEAWLRDAGQEDEAAALGRRLPKLKRGQALVYAPDLEILGEYTIREKRTFDSSGTPEVGAARVEPKGLADVDLAAIEASIGETLERAKQDDPKELRKRIRELERRLAERPAAEPERIEVPVEVEKVVEVPIVSLELESAVGRAQLAIADAVAAIADIEDGERPPAAPPDRPMAAPKTPAVNRQKLPKIPPPPRAPREPVAHSNGAGDVSPARKRILDALAALEVIGVRSPSKTQLALFAQASPKSSGYTNNLGALRTAGLIDYPAPGAAALTDDGRAIADSSDAPSTHDELLAYVRQLVGPARSRIIDALVNVYPDALPKDELADRAGASASSSGYTNNLGSLRSLGLIDYPQAGYAAATPVLFLEAP